MSLNCYRIENFMADDNDLKAEIRVVKHYLETKSDQAVLDLLIAF